MTYSYGPPHMAKQKQDDQPELTYSSYVRTQDVTQKTCRRRWMIGRSGERGSRISVLVARHDDDDDDELYSFNCNTSTHLFWIESINFLRFSDGISFQYCLNQDFKVSLSSNWRLFLYTLLGKIPHKFSIGFKSRDLVGESKFPYFLF